MSTIEWKKSNDGIWWHIVDDSVPYPRPTQLRSHQGPMVVRDRNGLEWFLYLAASGHFCDSCGRKSTVYGSCFPIGRFCLLCIDGQEKQEPLFDPKVFLADE